MSKKSSPDLEISIPIWTVQSNCSWGKSNWGSKVIAVEFCTNCNYSYFCHQPQLLLNLNYFCTKQTAQWDKTAMKCPQTMVKFMTLKGIYQLDFGTCHLPLQGLNHGHCSCWLSASLERSSGGDQEWGIGSGTTGRTDLQIVKILSRDFMSPDSCSYLAHLLIPRETLTPLTVTFALAIKEKTTIKSQNRVAVVQTFKEITRWHNGYDFRQVLVLLKTWVFWAVSDLWCH